MLVTVASTDMPYAISRTRGSSSAFLPDHPGRVVSSQLPGFATRGDSSRIEARSMFTSPRDTKEENQNHQNNALESSPAALLAATDNFRRANRKDPSLEKFLLIAQSTTTTVKRHAKLSLSRIKVGLRLITFALDRCCPCDRWPFASLGYSVDRLSVADLVTRGTERRACC